MASETQSLLHGAKTPLPKAPWTAAVQSSRNPKRFLPQAIAHRGYKASFPENTMGAFRGAVDVGAHAIETDVHLSSDGVVVLSHDGTLKRCFGIDKKIRECKWDFLSQLETLAEPKQGMARLKDLLEMLNEPGNEHIWVLLDVKLDDEADDLLGAVKRAFDEVPSKHKPWDERFVLGLWNATFLESAQRLLPTHPLFLIAFHLPYANHFFPIQGLGFNMYLRSVIGYFGSRFLRKARAANRPVLVWTVNEERWMGWCIRRNAAGAKTLPPSDGKDGQYKINLIDGVITDDPKLYREVCERWEDEQDAHAELEKDSSTTVSKQQGTGLWKGGLMTKVGVLGHLAFFSVFSRVFFAMGRYYGKFDYFKDAGALKR